jgi:hypothetical protein
MLRHFFPASPPAAPRDQMQRRPRPPSASLSALGLLLVLALWFPPAGARELLYPPSPPEPLPEPVSMVLQGEAVPPVPYEALERHGRWFVRLVPRDRVLDASGRLIVDNYLGTKQFVFASTPESVKGKSLLEIYLDIGYEATDVFRAQLNREMVLVLFRPPADIGIWAGRDGEPPAQWQDKIYVPTWNNVFALFERMAADATIEPDRQGEFAPTGTFFRSESDRRFVLSYPSSGKSRIRATRYEILLGFGGADCTYRRLLERKLSLFRHFKGDGRTHNEVLFRSGFVENTGLLEFLVPNRRLGELEQLYVVSIGGLRLEGADLSRLQREVGMTGGECEVSTGAWVDDRP